MSGRIPQRRPVGVGAGVATAVGAGVGSGVGAGVGAGVGRGVGRGVGTGAGVGAGEGVAVGTGVAGCGVVEAAGAGVPGAAVPFGAGDAVTPGIPGPVSSPPVAVPGPAGAPGSAGPDPAEAAGPPPVLADASTGGDDWPTGMISWATFPAAPVEPEATGTICRPLRVLSAGAEGFGRRVTRASATSKPGTSAINALSRRGSRMSPPLRSIRRPQRSG
jgi:hypothetical protein